MGWRILCMQIYCIKAFLECRDEKQWWRAGDKMMPPSLWAQWCVRLRLYANKLDIWFLVLIQGGREPDSRWVFNTLYKDFEIKLFDVFFFYFFFYSPAKNHFDPSADPLFPRQPSGCVCSCLLSAEPRASVARRWNLQSAFFQGNVKWMWTAKRTF